MIRLNLVDPAEQRALAVKHRNREAQLRRRTKDPERVRSLDKAWRVANPEATKGIFKRYRDAHRDEVRASGRETKRRERQSQDRRQVLTERYSAWRQSEAGRAWYESNREKLSLSARKSKLRRKYNMSLEDFQAMWNAQDGRCATCLEAFDGARVAQIDHSHQTGAVRGLLCGTCNRSLGLLRDNIQTLECAIAYLRKAGG